MTAHYVCLIVAAAAAAGYTAGVLFWWRGQPAGLAAPNVLKDAAASAAAAPLVVVCSTKDEPADYHVNICAGAPWAGYRTKMDALAKFASAAPRTKLLVFIDSDVFANPATVHLLHARWAAYRADIVLGGEAFCWVGRDCTEADVAAFYAGGAADLGARAPFVNSGGLAGTAGALADALAAVPPTVADDQLAWTALYANQYGYTGKIVIDTSMALFGSLVTGVPLRGPVGRLFATKRTCVLNGRVAVAACGYAAEAVQVTRTCDVVSTDGIHPVFWHGNGPANDDWLALQARRVSCMRRLAV